MTRATRDSRHRGRHAAARHGAPFPRRGHWSSTRRLGLDARRHGGRATSEAMAHGGGAGSHPFPGPPGTPGLATWTTASSRSSSESLAPSVVPRSRLSDRETCFSSTQEILRGVLSMGAEGEGRRPGHPLAMRHAYRHPPTATPRRSPPTATAARFRPPPLATRRSGPQRPVVPRRRARPAQLRARDPRCPPRGGG